MLIAQVYQRRNPLPSCPPSLIESQVDWESREYFSNTAANAWGPGVRGKGLSLILSDGVTFKRFGVCEGGGRDGFECMANDECLGNGVCYIYLQCDQSQPEVSRILCRFRVTAILSLKNVTRPLMAVICETSGSEGPCVPTRNDIPRSGVFLCPLTVIQSPHEIVLTCS